MFKFYMMNMAAFIAGTALYTVVYRYSFKRRVILFLLGVVALNMIVAILVVMEKADRHIYPFLCTLPFLLPHIFMELKSEFEHLPPKKRKTVIIGHSKVNADNLPPENCEYGLLVRLKLQLDSGRTIIIRSKAGENLPFLQWVNRVLYDYVLKYPYTVDEITDIRGKKIDFYHYRFHLVKYMIESHKTFKENKLKNNSRIYGKQVG